jgi:hypothetical protein
LAILNLTPNLARPKNIGGRGKLKQVYENKEIIFMNLITRLVIVVAIVVSISEIVSFALIQEIWDDTSYCSHNYCRSGGNRY